MKKICFAASTGGHFEQIMMLKPLMKKYESFIITEATKYKTSSNNNIKTYYIKQINRHEKSFLINLIRNTISTLRIYIKEKPDVIISTGALASIPICIVGKVFGKRIIFIESFAKITSPTLTGKFVYKFADKFYVQWKEMEEIYPKAEYKGALY